MNKDGAFKKTSSERVNNVTPRKILKNSSLAAPVEAEKELTKPLNKYVVSIVGDKVTFTDDIWAAIEALVDKAVVAELERLYALPNIQYQDPHVEAIYKSAIKDRLAQLNQSEGKPNE